MNPNNNNNLNRQRDCMDDLKDWWGNLTWFVRFLIASCFVIWILDLLIFGGKLMYYFVNLPEKTLFSFQIWRLVTACFVHMGLFDIMISVYSIYSYVVRLQREMGTVYLTIDFFAKQALLQTVFTLLMILLSLIFGGSGGYSFGMWTMVILYLSIDSFSNPEQETNFLCFPMKIKKKWYPFSIIAFFYFLSIMMGGGAAIRFDWISAIIFGWIEVRYFNGIFMRLSKEKILSFESKFPFKFITNSPNFVSINNVGSAFLAPSSRNQLPVTNEQAQSSQSIFGGRGVQIGGGGNVPVQNQGYFNQPHIVNPYGMSNSQVAEAAASYNSQPPQPRVINPSVSGEQHAPVFIGKPIIIGSQDNNYSKQNEDVTPTPGDGHVKFEDESTNQEQSTQEKAQKDNYSALNQDNSDILI